MRHHSSILTMENKKDGEPLDEMLIKVQTTKNSSVRVGVKLPRCWVDKPYLYSSVATKLPHVSLYPHNFFFVFVFLVI